MPFKDKEKHNKYYQKNKQKYANTAIKIRERNSKYVREIKEKSCCIKCGENHIACLHFHHRDASIKIDGISALVTKHASLEKIKLEIEKCDILCANCHSKLHYEDRQR